jgi:outer membrane protein OmpA-like peptidoglycan-associated protein
MNCFVISGGSIMKIILATTCIVSAALLAGGCATKNYVRNTTAPIQAKVDQVDDRTTRNSQQIDETNGQVKDVDERAQRGISAAHEQASTALQDAANADKHAGDAMNRADQAAQAGEQNKRDLDGLKDVVANIDDYKLQTSVSALFKFNQYALSPEARASLDALASQVQSDKRFLIAVEGYTDSTGDREYNEALSRRRAEAVVEYLVARHDIPIYKIHMVGLGEEKPVDDAKTRDARAKNRRVEVKVFSADQVVASLSSQE